MNQMAEDLRAAARYIDDHGWHQGSMEHEGRVCAVGALGATIFGDPAMCGFAPWANPEEYKRYRAARTALAIHLDVYDEQSGKDSIPEWNDAQVRIKEDVTAAMEKAAARAEEIVK